MKKSRADDGSDTPEQRPQILLKATEALKSITLWIKWLTMTYQSFFFENGVKYKGPILDNCPACGGLGFIGSNNSDGYACTVCLTGKDKHERLDIPYHLDEPICQFINTCPFKDKSQKQEKCHKCRCKFDSGSGAR